VTFIIIFHTLGPRLDTLRLCLRPRSDNESELGQFFKGSVDNIKKKSIQYLVFRF
jgi:hypothetical protein